MEQQLKCTSRCNASTLVRWLLLGTLLCLLLLGSVLVHADEARWTAPQRIAALPYPAYEPRVVLGANNTRHVVFFGGPSEDQWTIHYTFAAPGGAWSAPRIIGSGNGSEREADLAVGPDGSLHMVYEHRANYQIYYRWSADSGATWSTPVNVSRSPAKAFEPAVAVGSDGAVYVAWIDRRWSGDYDQATFASGRAAQWNAPLLVSQGTRDRGPDIAVLSQGTATQVQIVYAGRPPSSSSNTTYDLWLRGGPPAALLPARVLWDGDGWAQDPSIVGDGRGDLFVAWDQQQNERRHVYLMRGVRGGAAWTPPRDIMPRAQAAYNVDLAWGGAQLHIGWHSAWTLNAPRQVYTLGYQRDANTFDPTITLLSTQQNESWGVSMAAAPFQGQPWAVWQSRDGGGPIKAWGRGGAALDLPAAAPSKPGGPARVRLPLVLR